MTHTTSTDGLKLIQQFEGFRSTPAQMPDGNWVVGHGHVRVEAGEAVTEAEAAELLAQDVASTERLVNARVTKELTQSQFDALVSFAFSVGAEAFEQSQVLRRTNAGDFVAAAFAMEAWRKSDVGGELAVVDALVRRRAAEKALFLKDVPCDMTPSAFVRPKLDYAASVLAAPIAYATVPAVGSVAVAQPKQEPALVLTQILKSEPATEALLLTQVVPPEVDVAEDEEVEIVTAHAKPVARPLDDVRAATRRAYQAQQEEIAQPSFWQRFLENAQAILNGQQGELKADRRIRELRNAPEKKGFELGDVNPDVIAPAGLIVFGLALIGLGVSLVIGTEAELTELLSAGAVVAPGIAACLMGGFGLTRIKSFFIV